MLMVVPQVQRELLGEDFLELKMKSGGLFH
jgi:hypothetical protein